MPTDVTIWDWLLDSPSSSLKRNPSSELRGYSNAITGERINYAQVQEATTYLSTALVRKYGLKSGEVVALFSPNNIWYPVAMLGTLRAGMLYGPLAGWAIALIGSVYIQAGLYLGRRRPTTSKR